MPGIPPALNTDTEDVTWALQTAEALWKRNERLDALVWLRRAAQAAGEAEQDDRALELAHDAAELTDWIAAHPAQPSAAKEHPHTQEIRALAFRDPEPAELDGDQIEEVSIELSDDSNPSVQHEPGALLTEERSTPAFGLTRPTTRSQMPPAPQPDASDVPSAAQKHAGMLDPWSDAETHPKVRLAESEAPTRRSSILTTPDLDDLVTSAPATPIQHPASPSTSTSTSPTSADAVSKLDLSKVDALSDLPAETLEAFARAAVVDELSSDEEISGFALALILEGSMDLAATIADTPAKRLKAGDVVRARGTLEQAMPVRLVAVSERARVAAWNDHAVREAFGSCPWVENDLRVAADELQALVGITLGPLGERLDPVLRTEIASKLTLRALAAHEVLATKGKPVPGLVVVGAGELELLGTEGAPEGTVLSAGDFLFPQEILRAGPAPRTARAAQGGALVLFVDRRSGQELLVTYPLLLELFAEL